MDVYDFAMKMEKDGERFYRELAEAASDHGLKTIFGILADAETAHYELFRKMKGQEAVKTAPVKILTEVRNVFETMRDGKVLDGAVTQLDVYRKAMDAEKASRDFYAEQAESLSSPGQKEVFLQIAAEEGKHFFILEEIVNFVSRPETWLEDAEWYDSEEKSPA